MQTDTDTTRENESTTAVGNSNADSKLPSVKEENSIDDTLETISKQLPPTMIPLEEQQANLNNYVGSSIEENPKKRRRKSSSSSSDGSFGEGELEDGEKKKKKQRLHWTSDLHKLFVAAVNQLGIENAAPKTIHQLMHQPFLTSEHIKSHLQKYRMSLKKQQNGEAFDYDGRRNSCDSLRDESEDVQNSLPNLEGPRRMSIYDSDTTSNLPYSTVPTNIQQPAPLPSMYQNNSWGPYGSSSGNNNSLNMNFQQPQQQNPVYNNSFNANSEIIPNYQFPSFNQVPVRDIYPTTQNGELINNNSNYSTSRSQSLLSSIPGLSMDSLGVVVDHIAKSDETVSKLWTDAKLQATLPEHYKYLMLGFRIGLYSGVKYDGAETTLDCNNGTAQQQPQMEYPSSYSNMNMRPNRDPEMYKYMYNPQF